MCGRFTLGVDEIELKEFIQNVFDIKQSNVELKVPRYNVAPGQDVLSVISDGEKYRIGYLKWRFVPAFAKDEKSSFKMINAKLETLSERVSYKKSFQSKRCVILADGFYEWEKGTSGKQPMHIKLSSKKIFPMAGLWSTYIREDGSKLHSCTIITTEANKLLGKIHDRMPVILNPDNLSLWLDPKLQDMNSLSQLLVPYDSIEMEMHPVPKLVNQVANDSVECIKNIAEDIS